MSAIYNFEVNQFSTFNASLLLKDDAGVTRDLSTYIAKMQVRYRSRGGSLLFTLSMDDGITIDENTNIIYITISSDRTAMLKDDAFYDIVLINNDDTIERILEGQLIINEGVTR